MIFSPVGKKVIIMGLGLHGGGVSSALFFARAGAHVLVTDLSSPHILRPSLKKLKKYPHISYVLGKHRSTDFTTADVIIRNPAVPNDSEFLRAARKKHIPVHTDISWFLSWLKTMPRPPLTIGITGTKGKSTTAALIHHILQHAHKKSLLAGNICASPLDNITIKKPRTNTEDSTFVLHNVDYVVLELSSWHIESLVEQNCATHLAIITNLMRDHLNRYVSFADYIKAKKGIYQFQNKHDILFLNENDDESKKINPASVIPRVIWFGKEKTSVTTSLSVHEDTISCAQKVASAISISSSIVAHAIRTFNGLPGRLEYVAVKNGVTYINDTCATQPNAVVHALLKLSGEKNKQKAKKIILIAGGQDKNLRFDEMVRAIADSVKTLILFTGTASDKIQKALSKVKGGDLIPRWSSVASMRRAVALARRASTQGDSIILSPGAASFGIFKHEFDRGDQFKKEVEHL